MKCRSSTHTHLVEVLQCQHHLSTVQSYLLLLEPNPLHQVCEELPTVHIICHNNNNNNETGMDEPIRLNSVTLHFNIAGIVPEFNGSVQFTVRQVKSLTENAEFLSQQSCILLLDIHTSYTSYSCLPCKMTTLCKRQNEKRKKRRKGQRERDRKRERPRPRMRCSLVSVWKA